MNNDSPADTASLTNHYSMMRLWQLISPSLPIGAYAYSQALETAVENHWVTNEQQALDWIEGILRQSLSQLDGPILVRFFDAWNQQDLAQLQHWNHYLLACRESSELYQEDLQLGLALKRLLKELFPPENVLDTSLEKQGEKESKNRLENVPNHPLKAGQPTPLEWLESPTLAAMFSLAALKWQIPIKEALQGFFWSWCENQVAAGIKLIPLGQTAGQRILSHLITPIEQCTEQALRLKDDEIGTLAPSFAIASARHEQQYSRLFRS